MTRYSSERRRVLIADDDRRILDLLVELLDSEGYEVLPATDGQAALDLVGSFEPDVIISDVVMPVMGGIELCERLKRDVKLSAIPVLLISGVRRSDDDDLEGLNAGADDYLDIPFRNEELLVKVARLTERHRVEKHYREIVEQAVDIIYTRSMTGYITSINTAGARFFGRNAAEVIGLHLSDLIGPEAAQRDIAETAAHQSDSPLRSLHRVQNAEGSWRYLEGVITVERDHRGIATAVRGVIRDVTDRKRAHDALRETEERLRTVVGSASIILFATDRDGVVTLSEGNGLKGLELKPGEINGRSIFDLYPSSSRVAHNVRTALAGETVSEAVPMGELVFDTRYSPLRDDNNNVVGVIGVATDITENRRAQQAVQENEERYRELFENANDIIYTHDLSGNFTSLNRTGEAITGYDREEALKMNVADVIAPEYLDLARRMTANKAVGEAATVYELEIIAKSGRRVRLEVSTRLIYREGKAVGIQGIARDLTERKKSEEALRESQAFFNTFMDNSPAVAFMKDEEGRYVYVNKPFEQLFGQPFEFLRGKRSFDWLPTEFAQHTHDHDLKVLATGVPEEVLETVATQDGSPHQWLVFKFPTVDALGKRYVGGVGVDVSERRRAEEALAQQAEREAITHRISQTIRCSLDSAEVFRTAVTELGSYLNVDRCSLFMRDERAKRATNVAEYHVECVEPAASDFDLGDLRDLVESLDKNGVLVFNDAASDPRIKKFYDRILSKANVRSIMYVAITVGDDIPAAFALSTTRCLREWSQSDIAMAKAIADQTGIAIRQAQLYQKAAATSSREVLVNRLTMAIRASLSLPAVLSTATRELGRTLEASRVHLLLYNPDNPISRAEHEYLAPGSASVRHLAVSFDDPIGTQLLKTAKPVVIDNALDYSEGTVEFNQSVREHAQAGDFQSQIYYPLVVKGVFRGALCIHQSDRLRLWTDDEVALVQAVAERLAIGIAQAELFEMVARGKTEWETTFDAMSDGIFIFDRDGLLKRVNRAGAAMEATHPRLLQGRKCCDILRTSEEDQRCIVESAVESASSVTIEITPDRLNRPLLVSVEPVYERGNLTAVVCTARDLSELRSVQAVAREHQTLLNNILESARESIYAVDTNGRFKWCNSATLAGLGFRREDFIGRHLLDMVYEPDRELVRVKLNGALQGEPQTYEMRYFSFDGRLRYARVDNSPLVVEGHTTGVLGIARDITEQKEERERAARADKLRALGQLASGVAHDFNNSLAAILGRAQLMRRLTQDDALVRNLEIIQTAAEDAAATVRRIQTFARKSPAREFEMLDVRGLLHDAIEITRTRWENEARLRGLDYDVELEADEGMHTFGSASELREVFVNLIVNAVDAMPSGGNLSISCVRQDRKLQLRFADTGSGMPDDVRQKIFDPFFTTKGAHGTGLGLSVSHSIIERHEGTISVASELGGGAIFTIELPAAETGPDLTGESEVVSPMPTLSILVVDDEAPVRETLAEMLEALGHRVTLAESGHEALLKLRAARDFDFVFTDLAMPDMDGWETAREIRKQRPDMKIVLVTGYGPGTLPPSGEETLVDGIIGKPFDFGQVADKIRDVVGVGAVLENVGA